LNASGELTSALTIFLQGDGNTPNGIVFGDGLRCVSGNLLRLYVKSASAGSVSAPQGADPSVSARSATLGDPLTTGAIRYYAAYYRDPNAGFCPSATFNVGNGYQITW
jgi:hypothetical protein